MTPKSKAYPMLYNKRVIRFTAKVLLCTLTAQLVNPAVSSALSAGPSQPEVQSFEPVGTTDMVDMFSGDFVYNIPLLDVEGYPVNISYHGGVDMEQEASWVGLGWNINPGVINRTVRGLPDDMNGETIGKQLNIKDEKNVRVGVGVSGEMLGNNFGLSIGADVSVNLSNYRGVSADIGLSCGVNVAGMASAGVNFGVGSQSGADVDLYGGFHFNSSQIVGGDVAAGVGFNFGTGYNSRSGVKDINYGLSFSLNTNGYGSYSRTFSSVIPIGVKNIVPVITNATTMHMYRGRLKIGGELFGGYAYGNVSGMVSTLRYDHDGSMPGYGYLYAQNGNNHSIMDFTRDKDGMFNETMKLLPLGNMTYDIYGVTGQGTGGSFRPYRNDFGSVFDPVVTSTASDFSAEIEAGIGNLVEVGADITTGHTDIQSGPWEAYQRPFTQKQAGSIYENVYFKQAGEVTETNPSLLAALQGTAAMDGVNSAAIPITKPGSESMRDPRGNLIYYFTGDEASSQYGVASSQQLYSYDQAGFPNGSDVTKTPISRLSNGRTGSQISEIVQVQTDGRRYVYGIPAMNVSQREVTMAVDANDYGADGLTDYSATQNSTSNGSGRDHFYSKTTTPGFAHSYLLSSVLSTDYVDVKGDGPTDDDFGSFTKFNYTRKNASYGWKAPYNAGRAQLSLGFKSDHQDNKASFTEGEKEIWMLHSIETRNFVAEFYTSSRNDGYGTNTNSDYSYKLDSIRLFNKHDRFINKQNAVPIKTVIFNYTYELCTGIKNNIKSFAPAQSPADNEGGKLTLRKIYVRYGNSDRSMLSPYKFSYSNNNPYQQTNRDRWGGYKVADPAISNMEYPYVNQNDPNLDKYASSWSLSRINLPSGGTIEVNYEADDYAYVMDKPAMEMFKISGVGKSTSFNSGNQLYSDKNNPSLYLYFERRQASELAGYSMRDNYLKDADLLYYCADTRLVNNSYEPVKGYATVEDVGACDDNIHGYIKLAPTQITGGGATLNPISYTAINFGRYYLPHIIFPGADPDQSGLMNVLSGLKYAFGELLGIMKNPVKRMTEEGKAKDIKIGTSFVRLNSPGLKKKGGGQRVKTLSFLDHWNEQAGGNTQAASYGKSYDYTIPSPNGQGSISSGVASYEPQIGGDENPFRMPIDYVAQSGGGFPPHDPIGLYQEYPIGESLYPGATVGYSRVTVKSIHQDQGRSSQGVDIYDFYTAKDYPVQVSSTPLNKLANSSDYGFFTQKRIFEGSQGYTLMFNDMHGKPRRTEHRIIKPSAGTSELVSYKQYNYFGNGTTLSNDVPVVEYDAASNKMKKMIRTVGLEGDITIDTREKKEEAKSTTYYVNVNISIFGIIPVLFPPLPPYSNDFNSKNEFRSVVATKVLQRYGILKEVISSDDGAITTVRNEAFDPVTGQALITSVNNEYYDQEFNVNYPAYWGYKSMGPSYHNTGYEENIPNVEIVNHAALIPITSMSNYRVGDEVYMTSSAGPVNAWVTSIYLDDNRNIPPTYMKCGAPWCQGMNATNLNIVDTLDISYLNHVLFGYGSSGCDAFLDLGSGCGHYRLVVKPRYKAQFPQSGTLTNVHLKVIRSGAKNQLSESIQNYTGMETPFDGNGFLKDNIAQVISLSAKEYSDTLTAILPRYDSLQNPGGWDSVNVYVNGTRQIKRLSKEYAFIKDRTYASSGMRKAGLFTANLLWRNGNYTDNCIPMETKYCAVDASAVNNGTLVDGGSYNFNGNNNLPLYILAMPQYAAPNYSMEYNHLIPVQEANSGWKVARTVTKYSPWGFELENKDAVGNYTAAIYGANQQLPVALAQNAQQQEIMSEGFEDYYMLHMISNLVAFNFSPFSAFFGGDNVTGNSAYQQTLTPLSGMTLASDVAHTGKYSLKVGAATTLSVNVLASMTGRQPRYQRFSIRPGTSYVVSYWMRPSSISTLMTTYNIPTGMTAKSQIIEKWQQVERVIPPVSGGTFSLTLPGDSYIDDIRIYPFDANMKCFVYHPVNQKLIATLDENNFATFYEYDLEGNLVRTKKETEKGISTITESRSANVNRLR